LGGVDDLPDDDGGDLDRVAVEVVDLELARLEVAYAQGHAALAVERVRPARAGIAHRADVAAEELEHLALVRRDGEEAAERDQQHDAEEDREQDRPDALVLDRIDEPRTVADQECEEHDQHRNARRGDDSTFVHDRLLGREVGILISERYQKFNVRQNSPTLQWLATWENGENRRRSGVLVRPRARPGSRRRRSAQSSMAATCAAVLPRSAVRL